jgi:hypothetical protein
VSKIEIEASWPGQAGDPREEKMGRRIPRDLRPFLEEIERRELLSAITDVMAANRIAPGASRSESADLVGSQATLSSQSIAASANQGPLLNSNNPNFNPINNMALAPTGTLSKRQQKKERFVAQFEGTYTVGAGRTSDEQIQTFITAAGTANSILHADIQLLLVTPKDPSLPIGGVSAIFDRNLNSNTALGLDVSAPQSPQYVNRLGLPSLLPTVSLDANLSSGTYDEGYAVGSINIRYMPSGKHTPGVISQGKAIVTIHAQIYTANVGFILRNANIDP